MADEIETPIGSIYTTKALKDFVDMSSIDISTSLLAINNGVLGDGGKITFGKVIEGLGSADSGNLLEIGSDGKLLVDSGNAILPPQTGNEDKFLKTNGTVASWQPIPPGTNIIEGETTNALENVHIMTEAEFEASEHPATDLECVPLTSVPLDYYNGVTVAMNTEYAPIKDGVLLISGTTASTFTLKVDTDVTKTMGGFYLPVFIGQTIKSTVAGVFYPYQGQ